MAVHTIALEAIADAAEVGTFLLDDANDLARQILANAGVTPELDSEVDDLQALLVEAILRNPALATYLEQVTR